LTKISDINDARVISKKIDECRICKSSDLKEILDLGSQPPANSLRNTLTDPLKLAPLTICRCENCALVQLTETLEPGYLFSEYLWVTGTSGTAKDYSEIFCDRTLSRTDNQKELFVLEIASNDGTFLQPFKNKGHRVLGVDPAKNLGKISNEAGITTYIDFFGLNVSKKIVENYGYVDIIFARNVISHADNAHDVVAGIANSLKDDGVGVIEFHRADVILEELQYDSIYHEHLFYHSLKSINILIENFGLNIFDISESPISGGSFVIYFSKKPRNKSLKYKKALGREETLNSNSLAKWMEFASRCKKHKEKLNRMVSEELSQGKNLIGFGASARSATLLNFCRLNNSHVKMIADNNTLKHNKFTPGSNIEIASPSKAFSLRPDTILLLAWNFKDEIINSLKTVHNFRGHIIIPLPSQPVKISI